MFSANLGFLFTDRPLPEAICAAKRIMFDCYHQQIMGGDLTERFRTHLPLIGHVQIAPAASPTGGR